MIYKIENVELVSPELQDVVATYSVGGNNVVVYATLISNENKLFNVFMGNMKNTDNWGDSEVMDFALQQLENFKV